MGDLAEALIKLKLDGFHVRTLELAIEAILSEFHRTREENNELRLRIMALEGSPLVRKDV